MMNKIIQVFLSLLFVQCFLTGLPSSLHAKRVYLDVTASDVRKVVVAIPAFQNMDGNGQEQHRGRAMAELLGRALEFHGFVRVVSQEK